MNIWIKHLFGLSLSAAVGTAAAQDQPFPEDSSACDSSCCGDQFTGIFVNVDRDKPYSYSPLGLSDAFNNTAGLYFERMQWGGMARLQIRGIRPYPAVETRNTGIYWNGIPLTGANTYTDISFFDPFLFTGFRLIKGPTSYCAGGAGLLMLETKIGQKGDNAIETGFTYGSNGLLRFEAKAVSGKENQQVQISYINQSSGGYRERGDSKTTQLNLVSKIEIDGKRDLSILANYYSGEYGMPGGLDSATVADSGWSANPFANIFRARKECSGFLFGITHQYKQSSNMLYSASLFFNTRQTDVSKGEDIFHNGFEMENLFNAGGRFSARFTPCMGKRKGEFTLNIEAKSAGEDTRAFSNYKGDPKTELDHYMDKPRQLNISGRSMIPLPFGFRLLAGAGWHYTEFGHFDLNETDTLDYTGIRVFTPLFSPEICLEKRAGEMLSFYAKAGISYNLPAPEWIVVTNGEVTADADAEKYTGIEYGLFMNIKGRLNLQADMYISELDGMNVNSVPAGTDQRQLPFADVRGRGIEIMIRYNILSEKNFSLLTAWASSEMSGYSFLKYDYMGVDYAGNALAGMPSVRIAGGISAQCPLGFKLLAGVRHSGPVPLDDIDTHTSEAYTLLNIKMAFEHFVAKTKFRIQLYAGIDNALNVPWSSWIDVNNSGGRYYYPYSLRNYFGGISLRYFFFEAVQAEQAG